MNALVRGTHKSLRSSMLALLHRSRFMVEEVDRGLGLLIAKGAMGVALNAKYINPNYMLLDLGNNNRMIPWPHLLSLLMTYWGPLCFVLPSLSVLGSFGLELWPLKGECSFHGPKQVPIKLQASAKALGFIL